MVLLMAIFIKLSVFVICYYAPTFYAICSKILRLLRAPGLPLAHVLGLPCAHNVQQCLVASVCVRINVIKNVSKKLLVVYHSKIFSGLDSTAFLLSLNASSVVCYVQRVVQTVRNSCFSIKVMGTHPAPEYCITISQELLIMQQLALAQAQLGCALLRETAV